MTRTKIFSPSIDWKFAFFTLFVLCFTLVRYFLTDKITLPEGATVRISGTVRSEPIRYENSQSLSLNKVKIYAKPIPQLSYQDKVVVEGVIHNNTVYQAEIVRVEETGSPLYRFRNNLVSFYKRSLPDPEAGLVSGITLGSKAGLTTNFWEELRSTGTAHVVVASGMNVTLVAQFIMSIAILFLTRKKAIVLTLAGIWLYCLMAGLEAPIVRAGVMGSIAFSAQGLGKIYNASRALILSALLMLIIKPAWIVDLGFILSFVATLSLIVFEHKVNRLIHFVPHFLREGLSTSLAAQIGVAPILFATFGQFNPLSPVINCLVLWVIAPLTIAAILGGLVGIIIPIAGKLVLWLVYPLALWFVEVIHLFS